MSAPALLVRAADGSVSWAPAHDVASLPAVGVAEELHGSLAPWELEVDAVYLLARSRLKKWDVHASRRWLEAAPRLHEARYYERWCYSLTSSLIETGVLTNAEVESGLEERRAAQPQSELFAVGQRVRVLSSNAAARWRTAHHRVPAYCQGKTGVVVLLAGTHDAPEERAFLLPAVREQLYRVCFQHNDLFITSQSGDEVVVELFQRWLVDAASPEGQQPAGSVYEALHEVVKGLLIGKGVLTQADIDAHVAAAAAVTASAAALGGRVVAAAWTDAAYKARLLDDAGSACAELGISTAGIARLVALENTDTLHNLVVCSLCSCYPRPLLGPPPEYYKSLMYRQLALREPRKCLAGFGVELPGAVRVVVSDSTADCRYLVLPRRPLGTAGWDAAALARLVTVDSLIGTALLPDQPHGMAT